MAAADNDHRERRCPMLGNPVTFSYCRTGLPDRPCRKIFDCWWERFDVKTFMEAHYSPEDIEAIRRPPQDKAVNIWEMIQKAQQQKK